MMAVLLYMDKINLVAEEIRGLKGMNECEDANIVIYVRCEGYSFNVEDLLCLDVVHMTFGDDARD